MPQTKISAVVFDLGGVLLRLNEARETFGLDADDTTFLDTWLRSESVRAFERGETSEHQFASQILSELRLPYGNQEFGRRFRQWPDGLYSGIPLLLEQIPDRVGTAVLSNTNRVHWNQGNIDETLRSRVDHLLLSFETGLLKPDVESFTQVTDLFACPADEVLFVDDNPLNIVAAAKSGLTARLTRGIDELRLVLCQERVLPV